MAASGSMVDPTKPEKFRVVIGDELLGKSTKEVFTGVRCKAAIGVLLPQDLTRNRGLIQDLPPA